MPHESVRQNISLAFGLCTYSERQDGGYIGIAFDAWGEDEGSCDPAEGAFPFGFQSRPHDPAPAAGGMFNGAQACSNLQFRIGKDFLVMPLGDPRVIAQLPDYGKGGSIQYGGPWAPPGPGWAFFDGATGGYAVEVPEGQAIVLGGQFAKPLVSEPLLSAHLEALNVYLEVLAAAIAAKIPSGSPLPLPPEVPPLGTLVVKGS
jgi:hypothetical protein